MQQSNVGNYKSDAMIILHGNFTICNGHSLPFYIYALQTIWVEI